MFPLVNQIHLLRILDASNIRITLYASSYITSLHSEHKRQTDFTDPSLDKIASDVVQKKKKR